jgi:hypothetical protein
MPIVRAGPNEYLLTGRKGRLENRGSAVQAFLLPGSVYVLVPGSKQEAAFEFTQETKDGIPLRFKGIVIYRITDPIAAARLFDLEDASGIRKISDLLVHVCLGELRHAVSHMTMVECIEQRKTTLSGVAETALLSTVHPAESSDAWGISIEVVQLAQVFIVDGQLRQQLEAEVRNEIRLKSEQSNVRTDEETRLAVMASESRVDEQRLANDRESLRREEALELARLARQRRMEAENLETERQRLQLEQQRFEAEVEAERNRVTLEAPVRRLKIETEAETLRQELDMRQIQNRVKTLDVEHELLLPRAEQAMRLEILPVEQAPKLVESASRVLQGTNLSVYGDDAMVLGQLSPLFEILSKGVHQAATLGSAAATVQVPEGADSM